MAYWRGCYSKPFPMSKLILRYQRFANLIAPSFSSRVEASDLQSGERRVQSAAKETISKQDGLSHGPRFIR
jgi:hypothetical protein